MSEILLFRITEINWNEIDIQSDILISQVWSVYRDGTIKSYVSVKPSLHKKTLSQVFTWLRARLKIVNIPKRRLFFRHTLPIFLGIHQVFLRQIGFVWRKNLSLLGIFPIFKQRLEQKRLYFADSRSVPGQQKPSIL